MMTSYASRRRVESKSNVEEDGKKKDPLSSESTEKADVDVKENSEEKSGDGASTTECTAKVKFEEKDTEKEAAAVDSDKRSKEQAVEDDISDAPVGKSGDVEEKPAGTMGNMDATDEEPKAVDDANEKPNTKVVSNDAMESTAAAAGSEAPKNDDVAAKKATPTETSKTAPPEGDKKEEEEPQQQPKRPKPALADNVTHLLTLYIVKEHPDSMVLKRFVMLTRRKS